MDDILDHLIKLLELTFRDAGNSILFTIETDTYYTRATNETPVITKRIKKMEVVDEEYNKLLFDSKSNFNFFILEVISTIATFDIKVNDKKMRSFYADVNKIHDIQNFVQFLFVRNCIDIESLNSVYEKYLEDKNDNRN